MCLCRFSLSGFPVSLREKLPKGNLPLSEVLRQSLALTDTGGSVRRDVPEGQTGKGHTTRPTCRRHGGGYKIY